MTLTLATPELQERNLRRTTADQSSLAASFLDEHAGEDGTTLVVTHGSLARLMVSSYFLGGPPAVHRHLWLDNCRLAVIEPMDGYPPPSLPSLVRRARGLPACMVIGV